MRFKKQYLVFKDAILDLKLLYCGVVRHKDMNLKHLRYCRDRLEVLQDVYEVLNSACAALKVLRHQKSGNNRPNPQAAIVAIPFTLFFELV